MIKHFGADAPLDPNTQISNHFKLSDLTVTNTGADNTPDNLALINLQQLGQLLDTLYDTIGPFNVLSAYRSQAVEDALTAQGQPTAEAAAGHVSFHSVGLGADIYPTTMSLDDYFGRMMAAMGTSDNPGPLWNQMAEVAYKPSQGSIHLAGSVTYRANNVVLALNTAGTYARLTADEIQNFADPYIQEAERAIASVETAVAAQPTLSLGVVLMGGLLLYAMFAKPTRRAATA